MLAGFIVGLIMGVVLGLYLLFEIVRDYEA